MLRKLFCIVLRLFDFVEFQVKLKLYYLKQPSSRFYDKIYNSCTFYLCIYNLLFCEKDFPNVILEKQIIA